MIVETVDPTHPDDAVIARAADIIRNGGLVVFPTETVYGLGANGLDATAVAKIFAAKGRPAWNPVILHVATADDARALTTEWGDAASRLADAFWPGPLTLVLPKRDIVPDAATAGLPAVAIRVPNHPVALALIRCFGGPIAAPSANRFTELSPTTAQHVLASVGDRVDLIIDGGSADVGIESTVIDLSGAVPTLLRPGTLSRAHLEATLGTALADARRATDNRGTPRVSPGRVERHYAPRADVWLMTAGEFAAFHPEHAPRTAALVLDWSLALPDGVRAVRMPRDPLAYARALYAALHELDTAGYRVVAIERPPDSGAWAGVHDRLSRASHVSDRAAEAMPGSAPTP
jgi:L-threonylcarbamoyladenylate synthase